MHEPVSGQCNSLLLYCFVATLILFLQSGPNALLTLLKHGIMDERVARPQSRHCGILKEIGNPSLLQQIPTRYNQHTRSSTSRPPLGDSDLITRVWLIGFFADGHSVEAEKPSDVASSVHGETEIGMASMFGDYPGPTEASARLSMPVEEQRSSRWSRTQLGSLVRADIDTVLEIQYRVSQTLCPDLIAAPPSSPGPTFHD